MSMIEQNSNNSNTPTVETESKTKTPKERYVLGESECYFEPASYLYGKVTPDKIRNLMKHEKTEILESQGRSLKVMFHTVNEVKFIGFITAGDGSKHLTKEDIADIQTYAETGEIVKAITADELVELF